MKMKEDLVCDNVWLLGDSDQWGGAGISVLKVVLQSVIEEFNTLVGVSPKEQLLVMPDLNRGYPECCRLSNGTFVIFLSARGDNNWSQFIYQFAHEYCHRLIGGPMDGELETTFWFEESVCEMSSMFLLKRMTERWSSMNTSILGGRESSDVVKALFTLNRYTPINIPYLQNLLQKNPPIDVPLHEWLNTNMSTLSEQEYHRDLYNQISCVLFGLFSSFPALWRILPFLYRPTAAEYSDFQTFITDTIPSRLTISIEHYPQLAELLTGLESHSL